MTSAPARPDGGEHPTAPRDADPVTTDAGMNGAPADDTPVGNGTHPQHGDPPTGGVVGVVGSPSSTGQITVDLNDTASSSTLLGDLVYMCHPLGADRHLLALGTVGEIETRNRWHEDPNLRGVLRVHGSLPHLSGDGDVRTARVNLQAVYETDRDAPPFGRHPRESGGSLGMSPTTGSRVKRVDQQLVDGLVARHADDVVFLGHVYRSDVRLPMFIRDFSAEDGAYHTGVFGRSGSGKTALATYMLALQMRHLSLSVFVFDPQGQFTGQNGMVLDLQKCARNFGRPLRTLSIAEDIQLPRDAGLVLELLDGTDFFRQLTLKSRNDNRDSAKFEIERLLRDKSDWDTHRTDELLRSILTGLLGDTAALGRIYKSAGPQNQLIAALQAALSNPSDFNRLLEHFAPIHSLFCAMNMAGQSRHKLRLLLQEVLADSAAPKPYVIVDLSARTQQIWLDSPETKARIMRKVASELRRAAEEQWRTTGRPLNCSVVFDEAARFATAHPDGDQVRELSGRLVEYVRETRKTGLGWTFITQEINSLHPGIYAQLRVRAFGYGLTSGADLNRLRDEVGSGPALELYKSFADPTALSDRTYPFMITGPVSPLSFTAAPVFLQVFTDKRSFHDSNSRHFEVMRRDAGR